MALALVYPEADERGRGKKGETRKLAETAKLSLALGQNDRLVLQQRLDLLRRPLSALASALRRAQGGADRRRPEVALNLTRGPVHRANAAALPFQRGLDRSEKLRTQRSLDRLREVEK